MAEKNIIERIRSMSPEEKKELAKKIGRDAHDWELTWGG